MAPSCVANICKPHRLTNGCVLFLIDVSLGVAEKCQDQVLNNIVVAVTHISPPRCEAQPLLDLECMLVSGA